MRDNYCILHTLWRCNLKILFMIGQTRVKDLKQSIRCDNNKQLLNKEMYCVDIVINILCEISQQISQNDWLSGFNVGQELRQWAIADGLGFSQKDDPETCHHNFDPPRRGWRPGFGTPKGIILDGNLKDIAPLRILHAPDAVSVHGGFRQASLEPKPSRPELKTLPIG